MEKIFECFEKIGIFLSDDEKNEDLILSNYIEDSLQYINFILVVENTFDIIWPDDALPKDSQLNISKVLSIIDGARKM